jgi:hypothetical protein
VDLFYRLVIHEATTPFEIGGNFKRDENSLLITAVPDIKTGINQTLTVPNPDFVRSQRKYRASHIRFISEFILFATKNTDATDSLIPFIM